MYLSKSVVCFFPARILGQWKSWFHIQIYRQSEEFLLEAESSGSSMLYCNTSQSEKNLAIVSKTNHTHFRDQEPGEKIPFFPIIWHLLSGRRSVFFTSLQSHFATSL